MKKIIALVLVAFVLAFAGNVNKPMVKKTNNVFQMQVGDTLGLNTGNTATVYFDTTTTHRVGLGSEALDGDSIATLAVGYWDGDETSMQINIQESVNGGTTWVSSATDTLTCSAAGATRKVVKAAKIPGAMYRLYLETYGTTDSMCVENISVWGK